MKQMIYRGVSYTRDARQHQSTRPSGQFRYRGVAYTNAATNPEKPVGTVQLVYRGTPYLRDLATRARLDSVECTSSTGTNQEVSSQSLHKRAA